MAADNAVNQAAGAARGAFSTAINQFNPLPGGKFGRTLFGTTALAGLGFVASGGLAAPFMLAATPATTALGTVGQFVSFGAQYAWAGGGAIASGVGTMAANADPNLVAEGLGFDLAG